MPTYQVTDPDTGKTLRLTGDSPPTEEELEGIFSQYKPDSVGKNTMDVLGEGASAFNRGIVNTADFALNALNAVPQALGSDARIPSIRQSIANTPLSVEGGFMEPGLARDTVQGAGTALSMALPVTGAVRAGAATLPRIQPAAESVGRGIIRQLSQGPVSAELAGASLAGAGGEVGEALAGQATQGQSPEFQANAQQVGRLAGSVLAPLSVAPVQGAVRGSREALRNAPLRNASPSTAQIRREASRLYEQIDDAGVRIHAQYTDDLYQGIERQVVDEGFDPAAHPEVATALGHLQQRFGQDMSFTRVEIARRLANDALMSNNPGSRRLARFMVNRIDDFMDDIGVANVAQGGANVGEQIRTARSLSRTAHKVGVLEDAVESAQGYVSGVEKGLRRQFALILKDEKKRRMFTPEELRYITQVKEGTKMANVSRFVGTFGITEGGSQNWLGAVGGFSLGTGFTGNPTVGLGIVGIGQAAKQAAVKLTERNVRLAQDIVRAGVNSRQIVNAYMRTLSRPQRAQFRAGIDNQANRQRVRELTGLLLSRQRMPLDDLIAHRNPVISNAAYFAQQVHAAREDEVINQLPEG